MSWEYKVSWEIVDEHDGASWLPQERIFPGDPDLEQVANLQHLARYNEGFRYVRLHRRELTPWHEMPLSEGPHVLLTQCESAIAEAQGSDWLLSGHRQDGETIECPGCGREFVHVCTESEGCSWVPAGRST